MTGPQLGLDFGWLLNRAAWHRVGFGMTRSRLGQDLLRFRVAGDGSELAGDEQLRILANVGRR